MATWQVTVSGKGIRRDTVDRIVKAVVDKYGDGAAVHVRDATPPESRADRFAAAVDKVADARAEFEELQGELQDWYDNLPENFQQGDKGTDLQQAIDELGEAVSDCETVEGHDVSFPTMY